jgi:hypothetical protein
MALSKAKLAAAVKKFSPLHEDGKTEEEVKAEIAKENDAEATDAIYYAIAAADKQNYYIVISDFRDINNFDKAYAAGDDVSHFEQSRLDKLVELGLVEKQ